LDDTQEPDQGTLGEGLNTLLEAYSDEEELEVEAPTDPQEPVGNPSQEQAPTETEDPTHSPRPQMDKPSNMAIQQT
jgi:hypothetical protein